MSDALLPCSVHAAHRHHALLHRVAAALRNGQAAEAAIEAALAGLTSDGPAAVAPDVLQRIAALEATIGGLREMVAAVTAREPVAAQVGGKDTSRKTDSVAPAGLIGKARVLGSLDPLKEDERTAALDAIIQLPQMLAAAAREAVAVTIPRDSAAIPSAAIPSEDTRRDKAADKLANAGLGIRREAGAAAIEIPRDTEFSARLAAVIQARGLTQREVAEMTGIARTQIGKLARGGSMPRPEALAKLTAAFPELAA